MKFYALLYDHTFIHLNEIHRFLHACKRRKKSFISFSPSVQPNAHSIKFLKYNDTELIKL